MAETVFSVACDFGSSGGKIFLGSFSGGRLSLEEIHRFTLQPIKAGPYYHTDVLYMWSQLREGMKKLGDRGIQPHSIGIDSWGVDYAYLNGYGELMGNPLNYRNERTLHTLAKLEKAGWDAARLYALSGNAIMPYNTLFQIYEDIQNRSEVLRHAKGMLFIPDLFAHWLCGQQSAEFTIASTSQMMDIGRGDWARDMLDELGFPLGLLPPIAECGSQKGMLLPSLAEDFGMKPFPVMATGSHDTASAVAAAPLADGNSLYLSSGSWSLIGAELKDPLLRPEALEAGFTNEGGFGRSVRFLKGINGLWILQLLQRRWGMDFPSLIEEARKAQGCPFVIDVSAPCFYNPADIETAIIRHCQERGQGTPHSRGEILYAFYQGLSKVYGQSVRELEGLLGRKASSLHIVGGGSRDSFLNELTAQEVGCPLTAGPVEGSALGNILIQLQGLGVLKDSVDMRALVRSSFPIETL